MAPRRKKKPVRNSHRADRKPVKKQAKPAAKTLVYAKVTRRPIRGKTRKAAMLDVPMGYRGEENTPVSLKEKRVNRRTKINRENKHKREETVLGDTLSIKIKPKKVLKQLFARSAKKKRI